MPTDVLDLQPVEEALDLQPVEDGLDLQPVRDTSRDSYEAQLEDVGVTADQATAATRQSDRQADLLAQQKAAGAQGDRWRGIENLIGNVEQFVVEPLTRPLSGAVGRAADVLIPGAPVAEPFLQQPGINLPRAGEATTKPGQVAAGVYNAGAELLAALSSPDAIALLPAASSKAVLTAWISQMAGHQPERVLRAAQLFKDGKTQEAVQEVATGVGELGMAELGRRHVMADGKLQPADVNGLPERRTGFQRTAEDFIEARPEMAAEPERVTPTRQEPSSPATQSPAANVRKGTEMPAETGEVTVGAPSPVPETVQQKARAEVDSSSTATAAAAAPTPSVKSSGPAAKSSAPSAPAEIVITPDAFRAALKASGGDFPATDTSVITGPVRSALEAGREVTLTVDGKRVPIVGIESGMLTDAKGQRWGSMALATGKDSGRNNITIGRGSKVEPAPGLISNTAAEAWADQTIVKAKGRVNAGLDPELMAAWVVKGAAVMERGVRKFSAWSARMIAEHGDAVRPHLRRIFEESQRGLARTTTDLGALKQRKLAARGSVSRDVAAPHRERMKTGRESFYEPQDVGRVEDVVSRMTSEELASVPLVQADGPQNIGVAARLESYRRLVAADNLDAAWRVMEQTMKEGTSLGQLVNQFKLLRGATPDGVMVLLNKQLLAKGYDPIRPAESMRIRRLAEEGIKANARWKEAERQWSEAPTAENLQRVETLQADAIAADSLLQEKLRAYEPRSLGNTLSTLLKGNLIAPMSQARNVVGNTANLALRGSMRGVATSIDAIDAMLRQRPRTRALVGLRGSKEAVKAIGRSLPESLELLRRGGSEKDLGKADARVGLRPLVALRDAITADVMGPKRNGKTPLAQRLLMVMEGSPFGMHAAAQLRLLGAADKPFRAAAQARLITEHVKVQDMNRRVRMAALAKDGSPAALGELAILRNQPGYTADTVAKAVKWPELFIDAESLARIETEAATAVFQNRNAVSQRIGRALSGVHPGVRFMFDTIVPFVTTPLNVIGEWMSYAPPVATFNLAKHAWRGEARPATQAAGKLVVGSMAFLAGQWLYSKGLVSPSLDQSDEQQKARVLSGQTMPPNRLNVSGLARALAGGDGTWQMGDETRDILSSGGVLGAVFQTVTDVNRRLEREPQDPSLVDQAEQFGLNYVMLTAGYGVNQSFLKGTSSLLEGLADPAKTDSWLATYLDGLSAIALPNTLTAISRATRENKPELRGDSLDERLNNQIKNRLAGVQRLAGERGADMDLPVKRDLWGRAIRETATGSNPFLTQFLDVTKAGRIPTDPVALHLYTLWRRTANNSVIPTPPDANFSIANKQFEPLTRMQVDRLQELVGEQRLRLATRLVDNERFYTAPAASQIEALKTIWNYGNAIGSMNFYKEVAGDLRPRRERAGFESK